MGENSDYEAVLTAVEKGEESAKTKLAWFKLCGRGGVTVDANEAVNLLEERAKEGDSDAAWMLGLCCEYGIGTEQDLERLESLYQQSCDSGNLIGELLMWNLGAERGKGLLKRRSGL